MNLALVGISHKTAPLAVREHFAISEMRIPEALRRLYAGPDIEETLIIATCNRVEFVFRAIIGSNGMEGLCRFIRSFYGFPYDDFAPCFYVHHDYEAVQHLFRVASGLDSLVVGEPQVLGQVKRAYLLAKEAETAGSLLDAVFHRVFNVAKRVRTETAVGGAAVSVSTAAVDLAAKVFGNLAGKTVMIIGAGQMGELAARHLVAKGASTVLVSNRTYAHAVALAAELRGLAIRFDQIWAAMKSTDIVISSTGCPHYILRREVMERLMGERDHRPLFLIDIAVPRDIDPAVGELPGCTLANVDSLQEVARGNLREREKAIEVTDRIIAEEITLFRKRQESLHAAPTIASLRRRLEEIRTSEIAQARGRLGELTAEQEETLEVLTRSLINKISHVPFTELKQAVSRPDRSEILGLVHTMFRLEEEPATASVAVN